MAYSAEGEIDRREFGLTTNMMLDGRWVVGDQVAIMIELELLEEKQEEPAATAGT
jgi:polyisoprenoid-binding protein YceI